MREIALFIVSGIFLLCFIGTLIQSYRMTAIAHERMLDIKHDLRRAQQDYALFHSWAVMYLVLAVIAMLGTIVSFAAARGYIE